MYGGFSVVGKCRKLAVNPEVSGSKTALRNSFFSVSQKKLFFTRLSKANCIIPTDCTTSQGVVDTAVAVAVGVVVIYLVQ